MAEVTSAELKILGRDGTSDNFGKVGSARAGSAVNTKVISTIQALAAWVNGLQDAVNTTKKAPYIEELNSIFYVITWNLLHVLEKGIPEWETTRIYYTGDIVKKNATFELYGSLGDSNSGNALPSQVDDANWQYLGLLGDIKGKATAAMQEAGTDTSHAVTPSVQQRHPSAAKAWVCFDGSDGTIKSSYNVVSVTKTSTGHYTVEFDVDFSSVEYAAIATCDATTAPLICNIGSRLVGSCVVLTSNASPAAADAGFVYAAFFGDQ